MMDSLDRVEDCSLYYVGSTSMFFKLASGTLTVALLPEWVIVFLARARVTT
jgi:hypothetical protein